MSTTNKGLRLLISPCNNAMCPALYEDSEGRVFVQGTKVSGEARADIAIAEHEEVVEVAPALIAYLRSLPG